ncbi:MAG: hypothetical protein D6674_02225 [Acidobacteria bacterium]|nr:MAG: hypothetical protein D6674_02225 [Acidobacteriota bacterium]
MALLSSLQTYNYIFNRYGIETVGALETLPRIPPTAKRIEELTKRVRGAKFVTIEVFRERSMPQRVARELSAELLVLPHDVGVEGVRDLFELYEVIFTRLSR